MRAESEQLASEMLTLPTPMRAFLAHKLIASLDEGPGAEAEAEWMEVIERRSQEIEAGTVPCRPVAEVVREIRGKLDALRRQPSRS